ncbi:uncharacterized protein [Cherax quadricarinatus]|uniref:uncharacterized protein n=1 Tax=Cherax quadricarinatus TaxID=27406 RepID=UPI00387E4F82
MRYKIIYPSWVFINGILKELFSQDTARGDARIFVEAGALDGEYLSNTLWLERRLGWTGLLIEAEADSYIALRRKHRRVWSSPGCLATRDYAHSVVLTSFRKDGASSEWTDRGAARIEERPVEAVDGPGYKTYHTAQCFPALTYFLALNITRVHFFSLDVEGVEMEVLRSFPFDRITVDVWAIEHIGSPKHTATPINVTVGVSKSLRTSITSQISSNLSSSNDASASVGSSSQKLSKFEDPDFIAFMEARGYYLFDVFCQIIPDYVFIRRGSDVFKRLRVPERLWTRRNLCLHKSSWEANTKVFQPRLHRDRRHWPKLVYGD